jgi:molybdenum cofactor biosynthesis enzyme
MDYKRSSTEIDIISKMIISQAVFKKYGITKTSILSTDLYLVVKAIGTGTIELEAMQTMTFAGLGIYELIGTEDKESLEILEWIKVNEDFIIKDFWNGRENFQSSYSK